MKSVGENAGFIARNELAFIFVEAQHNHADARDGFSGHLRCDGLILSRAGIADEAVPCPAQSHVCGFHGFRCFRNYKISFLLFGVRHYFIPNIEVCSWMDVGLDIAFYGTLGDPEASKADHFTQRAQATRRERLVNSFASASTAIPCAFFAR